MSSEEAIVDISHPTEAHELQVAPPPLSPFGPRGPQNSRGESHDKDGATFSPYACVCLQSKSYMSRLGEPLFCILLTPLPPACLRLFPCCASVLRALCVAFFLSESAPRRRSRGSSLAAPPPGSTLWVRGPSAFRSPQRRRCPSADGPGRRQPGIDDEPVVRAAVALRTAADHRPAAAAAAATAAAAAAIPVGWPAALADASSRTAARRGTLGPPGG